MSDFLPLLFSLQRSIQNSRPLSLIDFVKNKIRVLKEIAVLICLMCLPLFSYPFFGCQSTAEEKQDKVNDGSLVEEVDSSRVKVGAENVEQYLPFLKDKKVALVANQSSLISKTHLLDSLLSLNVEVKRIFTPEHGFRGKEDAGAKVESGIDPVSKLPLTSLYGDNKKPRKDQLDGIELMVFDLQDVGVRFYTYLSTLHYIMQAAAENGITVLVLDRPNPHMDKVDGPVMKDEQMSFVGLHPVPLLYGLSIGEYAKMINEEGWLGNGLQCKLIVIGCQNLKRDSKYEFPIPPSPNLPNMQSIDWYPSLALFEGTPISVGRGTDAPFQQAGHPAFNKKYSYSFTPKPTLGASNPKLNGEKCFGVDLRQKEGGKRLELSYLLEFYREYPNKDNFFNSFFDLLAGTDRLKAQIKANLSEKEIRDSWQEDLENFQRIRQKYLIYK